MRRYILLPEGSASALGKSFNEVYLGQVLQWPELKHF